MANRKRKNELKIYLSNDEQYILEQKVKLFSMRSKSSFLLQQILYGYVYNIDYSDLREYNTTLSKISNNLRIERHRKRLCRRCKGSQRVNEKSVGYSKSHALKTALHNCYSLKERVYLNTQFNFNVENLQKQGLVNPIQS